tara:strand:+ start:869 stop:1315 length:447 start_codon:yes stop_codon:yes gene_type:complete
METCLFCDIIKGKISSHKVYEDEEYLAFLDIYPNSKGMTLIIPKKHLPSDIVSIADKEYSRLLLISKKIAEILEKKLDVKRVAIVSEGMGIDHAHIKLYPLHGLKEKFEETWSNKKIFFKKYEGYISTQLGERASDSELENLAKLIRE